MNRGNNSSMRSLTLLMSRIYVWEITCFYESSENNIFLLMEGGCGGMVTLAVVWRVCRPAEVLLLLSQISSLRSRCGWSQEAKTCFLRCLLWAVTKAPLIQKVTVNRLFKYYPIQNLQPSTFTRAGRNAQLLKRTADRSDNNDRQWLKNRPTLRRLDPCQIPEYSHQPPIERRGRIGRKIGGWGLVEGVRPRNCVTAFVRAESFHWLGLDGAFRYSCSGRGSAAGLTALYCWEEVTDLWRRRHQYGCHATPLSWDVCSKGNLPSPFHHLKLGRFLSGDRF